MEAVFSQTDDQVMNKLRDYSRNEPDWHLTVSSTYVPYHEY